MLRAAANFVGRIGTHAGHRVVRVAIARDEVRTVHLLRNTSLPLRAELVRRDVAEIAACRVLAFPAVRQRVLNDSLPHERTDTRIDIPRTAHGVLDVRIQANAPDSLRERNTILEFMRLTAQRHETASLAERARNLIHNAARCADDTVLNGLAHGGELHARHIDAQRAGDGSHRRDFNRRRGTHSGTKGHVRRKGDIQPALESHEALRLQYGDDATHVRGPLAQRISTHPLGNEPVRFPSPGWLEVVERSGKERAHIRRLGVQAQYVERPVVPLLGRADYRLAQRPFQDQRAGIVRDAAHDVEPSRRPGDSDGVSRLEEAGVTLRDDLKEAIDFSIFPCHAPSRIANIAVLQ